MAQRRMFSPDIVDSDAFLEMPSSAQALYFHLGMNADDDGFVSNPRKIQRIIGVNDDDLKLLLAKKFLIPFESGVVVVKHWRINNFVRKDRYRETTHLREKGQLFVRPNQAYTLNPEGASPIAEVPWKRDVPSLPSGQPNGNQWSTQDRLGKDRLGKDSKEHLLALFELFWKQYPNKKAKEKAKQKWLVLKPDEKLFAAIMAGLARDAQSSQWTKDGGQFIPHPTTWLNQRRWEDEGVSVPAASKKVDRF